REQLARIPALRDLQQVQRLDYPTVDVRVDREKLGLSGGTVKELTDSALPATSSSRTPGPMFWPDPKTGIGFQVQAEVPLGQLRSVGDVERLMIHPNGSGPPLRVQNVAQVSRGTMPGEYDRYNMRRVVSLTANIEGEDLGNVA